MGRAARRARQQAERTGKLPPGWERAGEVPAAPGRPSAPAEPAGGPEGDPGTAQPHHPDIAKGEAISDLMFLRKQLDKLDARTRSSVLAARETGCSWASIGSALGCSGEGARRKYSTSGQP